ncbi:MAG: hypothetical protein ACYC1P_12490 [Gaiellaceae bacterium]
MTRAARRLFVAALAALAVAVPASGGGGTVFGLQGSQADGRLVRVSPTTLQAVGPALRVGAFTAERAFSPDGTTLALVSQERPTVRFVELGRMRVLGEAKLAAEGEVQTLRWTERGLVAVVDPPRGSQLVWLDPERRRVTRVRRYRGELADFRLAAGRIVVLEWPSGVVGPVRLNVVDADGRARSIRVDRVRGGWARKGNEVVHMAEPGLAIDPEGERAWLADGDGEICEVALDSLAVRCNAVRTLAKVGNPWSRRQLKLVADGTLALSGWEKPERGPRAARSIGLWLVDTSTWRRRLVHREIDSFRFAGGVIVGVRRNGVSAYGPDGSKRWGIEAPYQLGVISTAGPYVYLPLAGERTLVAELAAGRVVGRPAATARPFQDLDTW